MSTADRPVSNFWKNASSLLRKRGITSTALAQQIGVTPAALSRYRHGVVPSVEVAARIAQVLNVSLDDLVRAADEDQCRAFCPSTHEHSLLHELLDQLGLQDLLQLTPLETQQVAWLIIDLLAERFPTPLRLEEIRELIEPADDAVLRANLVALRRRGLIRESIEDNTPRYALTSSEVRAKVQEPGDLSMNLKRSIRMLCQHILPALERRDETGHLITFKARIPRQTAQQFSSEMTEEVKARAAGCLGPEEGDTDVWLSFGVAYAPPAR